ncbi:MAG: tetratricopeptide repeat protein [bacterium]|nr:tetratricopeptide repeat protein [bacterium]
MKKQRKIIISGGVILTTVIIIAVVLMVSGSAKKQYAKHMESAQRYIDELEYEQAIAEYRAAIEIGPNNVEAYRALAELYVQTGDYESAIATLNQGIEQTSSEELAICRDEVDKEKYNSYLAQAREYEDEQKYESAIEMYEVLLNAEPSNAEVYIAIARLYVREEEYDSAIAVLSQGMEQTGSAELSAYMEEVVEERYNDSLSRAEEYISRQQYEQAIEMYKTAIEQKPDKKEAYLALTEMYLLSEEYESAINILKQSESQELDDYLGEFQSRGCGNNGAWVLYAPYGINCFYNYDASGNNTVILYVDPVDDSYFVSEYEYGTNGNREKGKSICFNSDGTEKYYCIDEYNANGDCVKATYYYPDGTVNGYVLYLFDANGEQEKGEEHYYADGTMVGYGDYEAWQNWMDWEE